MDTLKMKFKLHGLEFELEGKEATVKEEFANFKSFITADLMSKVNIMTPQVTTIPQGQPHRQLDTPPLDVAATVITDVPTLKDIKLRDLAKSETDWLLVYAYYASEGGTKEFTRDNIIQLYKDTDRRTDNRIKSLSQFFKNISKALYIKSTNDTHFILLEKGKLRVAEIFNGNAKGSNRKPSAKTKSSDVSKIIEKKSGETKVKKIKANKGNSIGFVDLNLPTTEITALTDFFKTKNPKGQNEEVAVVMKWYKDHIKTNEISLQEINYLLSICSKVPSALEQVLINMKGPKFHWVANKGEGKVSLTSIGETHVISKLPKVDK